MSKESNLIFVDVEANGQTMCKGEMTEFGAVHYTTEDIFYGDMKCNHKQVFEDFRDWLEEHCEGRPIFVSDNPAFDWQWINHHFWKELDFNPFGWSARRISDYYAGLKGNFWDSQAWKKFRITKHTHMPVDDAMGNVEAFKRIEKEKIKMIDTIKDQVDEIASLKQQLVQNPDYLYVPRMEGIDNVDNIR